MAQDSQIQLKKEVIQKMNKDISVLDDFDRKLNQIGKGLRKLQKTVLSNKVVNG